MPQQDWMPRCVFWAECQKIAIERLPVIRPSTDDEERPGIPVCEEHRREVVLDGPQRIGYCSPGRHYGLRLDFCFEHKHLMTAA